MAEDDEDEEPDDDELLSSPPSDKVGDCGAAAAILITTPVLLQLWSFTFFCSTTTIGSRCSNGMVWFLPVGLICDTKDV